MARLEDRQGPLFFKFLKENYGWRTTDLKLHGWVYTTKDFTKKSALSNVNYYLPIEFVDVVNASPGTFADKLIEFTKWIARDYTAGPCYGESGSPNSNSETSDQEGSKAGYPHQVEKASHKAGLGTAVALQNEGVESEVSVEVLKKSTPRLDQTAEMQLFRHQCFQRRHVRVRASSTLCSDRRLQNKDRSLCTRRRGTAGEEITLQDLRCTR